MLNSGHLTVLSRWEGPDMVLPGKGEMLCRPLSEDASVLQGETVS